MKTPMRMLVALSIVATLAIPVHARSLAETVADARAGAPALGAVVVSCKGDAALAVEGVARIDRDEHLGEDARFNIGSNAKSMLASLAGVLVQEGRLTWTTTIGEVLGKDIPDLDATLAHATLAQLLSHRSGLPGYDTGAELRKVVVDGDTPSAQRKSFVRQVVTRPPAQAPGKGFVYSNAGYVVAGMMLERVGGKPFDQLMQEELFRPLDMTPRFGSQTPPGVGQPWGHRVREGGLAPYDDPDPVIPAFLQAAGDVSLTLADYGRYLREHLCGLRGQPTRVLDAATVQALHAPQGEDGAGMGWGRYELGGATASVHTGGTGTFSAFVAVQPGTDRAIATVTNAGDEASRATALALLRDLATTRETVGAGR
ncbi:serine hydrolase domain-containing protein [Dokdonella sp. MW10]|uniref:serine hydrolase domain-containing protein n=1 Tax=Dokdonella sp. MW10 TaxID=2992926 RepID=UPI003F80D0B3